MRFGRLAHDPARLAAAPQHLFAAALPPPVLNRSSWDFSVHLCRNDTLGDCTCAGLANVAAGIASLNGYQLVVDEANVVDFFAAQKGIDPSNEAALEAADGLQMADVLDYMQQHGFDVGGRFLAGQWGTLGLDRPSLALGMAHLGPIYLGVTLRERDVDVFSSGGFWDVRAGRDDGAVVSGHAVIAWDYSGLDDAGERGSVRIGTWGVWQPATWSWVAARLDEAHGVTFPPLQRADGTWFAGYQAGTLTTPA
jgi:hypothetical protein